jgi:hypothetical protein
MEQIIVQVKDKEKGIFSKSRGKPLRLPAWAGARPAPTVDY